jgi:hypothetical protein
MQQAQAVVVAVVIVVADGFKREADQNRQAVSWNLLVPVIAGHSDIYRQEAQAGLQPRPGKREQKNGQESHRGEQDQPGCGCLTAHQPE